MPWSGPQFHAHNHALSPAQSLHAAHIANAMLARGVPEGESIATANKLVHRDGGGMVPANPTPGLQPNVGTSNPLEYGAIQRFSAMSPEQLQELLPRLGGSPMAQIAQRVLMQKRIMPQAQPAVPAQARGGMAPKHDTHGMRPADDTVPILAAGGEFVVAPHHAKRWGDGDLKAGHKLLDEFVVEARKHIVKTMRKLKGPVRG